MKRHAYLFVALLLGATTEARTWTNTEGNHFEGEFIEDSEGVVKIRRQSDQRIFKIIPNTLCKADQTFIQQRRQEIANEIARMEAESNLIEYSIESFSLTLEEEEEEEEEKSDRVEVTFNIKRDNQIIGTANAHAPGKIDLHFKTATDLDQSDEDEPVYLYFKAEGYAEQWRMMLEMTGSKLRFRDKQKRIKLFKKRYAIIEYAFYTGEDPNFKGRIPTHEGIAAVSHWGRIPGFQCDWQIWQGSKNGEALFGDTLLLHNHRLATNNGFTEPSSAKFHQLNRAPKNGYRAGGSCGVEIIAEVKKSYYSKVLGHKESTKGYGKIYIREITTNVPNGMEVIDQP